MGIGVSQRDLAELKADVGACFAYEGDREPRGVANKALRHELAAEMKREKFSGRRGESLVWNADGHYSCRRFLVIGLGHPTTSSHEAVRQGCARAARAAGKLAAKSLALRLPPVSAEDAAAGARAAAEGALLGAYHFDRYLTDPARKRPKLSQVHVSADGPREAMKRAVALGEIAARAVCLARDLVNEAPSVMTPSELGKRAVAEARRAGLRVEVLSLEDLRKLGMHALLAVGRGSGQPPSVVHLTYKPNTKPTERIVLVGKGVTFDSGGLNLKPSSNMLTMKCDMAGAAAVLAAMTTLRELNCRAEVHGFLGLVENMTGRDAFKPGDILPTYSGKTVEVTNTDAEGRLVLCDLLAHAAATLRPDSIVDLATLTGACVVALGPLSTGVFSRHDGLRDAILVAGRQAGEKLWPLPMYEEYLESLQEGPADLRNSGDRWGGAITAALFLGEFVPEKLPWVHLDIAGPAFLERETPEVAAGGTGAGVQTLVRWLESV